MDKERMVCIGLRPLRNKDGQYKQNWLKLDVYGRAITSTVWMFGKDVPRAFVGSVWEFDLNEQGSAIDRRFVEKYPNSEQVALWELEDWSSRNDKAWQAELRRQSKDTELDKLIEPLREFYRDLPYNKRGVFLDVLTHRLNKP